MDRVGKSHDPFEDSGKVIDDMKKKVDDLREDARKNKEVLVEAVNLHEKNKVDNARAMFTSLLDKGELNHKQNDLSTLNERFDTLQHELQQRKEARRSVMQEAEDAMEMVSNQFGSCDEDVLKFEKEVKNLNEVLTNLPQKYSQDSLRAELVGIRADSQRLQQEILEVRTQLASLKERLVGQEQPPPGAGPGDGSNFMGRRSQDLHGNIGPLPGVLDQYESDVRYSCDTTTRQHQHDLGDRMAQLSLGLGNQRMTIG